MTKEAFEEQVVALRKQLFYVSYSLLPNPADQEDAVQECIYRALLKRETLRQDQYLKTWLIRILINVCHSMRKKRGREILREEMLQDEISREEIPMVLPETASGPVFEAIMGLSETYRLPVVLHYHGGYSVKETAQILRLPEGTVRSRLFRARKLLKCNLQEEEALA